MPTKLKSSTMGRAVPVEVKAGVADVRTCFLALADVVCQLGGMVEPTIEVSAKLYLA